MEQQTAVEFVLKQFAKREYYIGLQEEQQAIKMEKEQMRKIYEGIAQNLGHIWIKESDLPTFDEYYTKIYGKKEDDLNQISNIPIGSIIGKKNIPKKLL